MFTRIRRLCCTYVKVVTARAVVIIVTCRSKRYRQRAPPLPCCTRTTASRSAPAGCHSSPRSARALPTCLAETGRRPPKARGFRTGIRGWGRGARGSCLKTHAIVIGRFASHRNKGCTEMEGSAVFSTASLRFTIVKDNQLLTTTLFVYYAKPIFAVGSSEIPRNKKMHVQRA